MASEAPVLYLLHGDNEYATSQFIAELLGKLGDATIADMNTAHLDGRTASFQELETAVNTLPFMGKRRLVLFSNPLAFLGSSTVKERFLALIPNIPQAVALVMYNSRYFWVEKDKKDNKFRWIGKLPKNFGGRVFLKDFPLPSRGEMIHLVQSLVKEAGAQISPAAARLLASLTGENPRLALQEIHKVLAYTNYQRTIEEDDVLAVTPDTAPGDIFAMVDAIGQRNGKAALQTLHRLLEEQDALSIYGMIIRQFRLLLLAREVLDRGGQQDDVIRELKIHHYVAGKIVQQVRIFTMQDLERIYHRLLDLDVAIKTGQIENVVGLDTFIVSTTA